MLEQIEGELSGARAALAARWHLAVVSGPDPGWCVPVRRGPTVLGRDPGCDLPLQDPRLSRHHAEIRERRGSVQARDLRSANGTRWRRARHRPPRRRGTAGRWPARPVGRRWRRLPGDAELLVGESVVVVRARPGLVPPAAGVASSHPAGDGAAAPPQRKALLLGADTGPGRLPARRWLMPALAAASVVPLLLAPGQSWSRVASLLAFPLLLALTAPPARPPAASDSGRRGLDPPAVLLAAVTGSVRRVQGVERSAESSGGWSVDVAGRETVDPFLDGPVALVGEPSLALAAARWLICQLAVRHPPSTLGIVVDEPDHHSWGWAAELPHLRGATQGASRLLIVAQPCAGAARDGAGGMTRPTGARSGRAEAASAGDGRTCLVLVPRLQDVPSWCRRVIEVSPGDGRLVSTTWAREVAAALAAGRSGAEALPADVPVTAVLEDPVEAWPNHDGALAASFAVDDGGRAVEVDLARDGPHALVAGTTGSGKSELLLCWVLALAARYPPSALTVVAIDYKGGATFGPLADLPQVAGVLTDLDAAGTRRAFSGLRAELRRRERLLAAVGARDIVDYRRRLADDPATGRGPVPALSRLLVVVDEFRVLADEHPDLLAWLGRLAAQGRSLGLHLVLATQRPAGALSSDLRANLAVAVCLRVLGAADSVDVVGIPDGARLPGVPGRGLLRGVTSAGGTPRDVQQVQAVWSGRDSALRAAVLRVSLAAEGLAERRADPFWPPPLPLEARSRLSPAGPDGAARLPLLLLDREEERELVEWTWARASGPLLIAGGRGTGRTTALRSIAAAALNRGSVVHAVHRGGGLVAGGDGAASHGALAGMPDHPGLGTVVGADDPRRLVRLLDLLLANAGDAVLCVDDVDTVMSACDRVPGPGGADRLGRLLREGRSRSLGVAIAGSVESIGGRWAVGANLRLVLGGLDATQAVMAGVPRGALLDRPPPGRGLLLGEGRPTPAHVLLPEELRPADAAGARRPCAPQLLPLPELLPASELLDLASRLAPASSSVSDGTHVALPLGVGGDEAGVVWLDLSPRARVVVAGPAESGRTSALRWIAHRLAAAGVPVVRHPTGDPDEQGIPVVTVLDDADLLDGDDADLAARQWRRGHGAFVAAVRTENLAGYGGRLVPLLREARQVLLLAPLTGGCGHVPPNLVLPHADPTAPSRAGRGVVLGPRRTVPVQLPAL